MSETPAQFTLSIDKFADDLVEEQVVAVTQKLALTALRGVVMKSPVDTGRFRGNWNVGIGSIDYSITDNVDKTGQETINKGAGIVDRAPAYQAIWISNNLPYANRLENGWSKQAPAGMVALTFAELETMFR